MSSQKVAANGLSRSLSHGQMTMIALGLAVGTGLFLGSGGAIAIAGPAVIISYAVGSVLAAIIAGCAGEMAVRYPVKGGFGTVAGRYLGPYAGFLTRWAYWTTMVPLTGAELVAVGKYMGYWYPEIPLWLWVVVSGAIIVGLNLTSVKSFGTMEFFLSSIKVTAVIVFIIFGLILLFFGLPNTPATGLDNLTNDGGFIPNGLSSIWMSLAIVMFSFGGVELISISAAEAKDPVRSVSSSLKAMMYRLATFYVLAIFIIVAMMPWRDAANLQGEIETSPFVTVFSALNVPYIAGITNFVILTAALSGANAALYAATRQMHALAGDGMAPRAIAKTSANGIPVLALALSMLGSVVAVIMAITDVANIFVMMMSLVTICVLVVWSMILLSYMRFKAVEGNSSPFRVLGGRASAAVALIGVLATVVAMFFTRNMAIPAVVGIGFFALITVVYFAAVRSRHHLDESAFEEASTYANDTH
ncbi:amino acid permease [Rothia sp. ZJ932]|uniref:amino acid permease n=1 Tax=Rothia sp. ZJ932 TaxID=2810516 RepID=UPI001967A328|nr:amino acid permease [Rothia sp. ZJ932]QRZ61382.1 amino acid permease [Rothia sp. ZJ932]